MCANWNSNEPDEQDDVRGGLNLAACVVVLAIFVLALIVGLAGLGVGLGAL